MLEMIVKGNISVLLDISLLGYPWCVLRNTAAKSDIA